jgi:tRNA nucleotidyltransferase (CCA-adding enzyme)
MVRKARRMADQPIDNLAEQLRAAYPDLEIVRRTATAPVYLVGGAVRDLMLGRGRSANLDLAVEGDAAAHAARLSSEVLEHERFATATVRLDDLEVDVAATRTETYAEPGALPEVRLGATIEEDLGRRDFTINAMAVPLEEPRLIDPHHGAADLEAGVLRVLHRRSFVDDPTRAIRAARYAARLDLSLEEETEQLLLAADLNTVSADRREAELLRLAGEASAPAAYRLLDEWGLLNLRDGGVELARRVGELLELPLWQLRAERNRAVHEAATGKPGGELALSESDPTRPSEAVALATAYGAIEVVLARAYGAGWLDDYLETWSKVGLEIGGEDLIAAGVEEGPAVGRGLAEAKRRKLDGEISGRDEELAAAIAAAREE